MIVYLRKRCVHSLGIVRRNRLKALKITNEKDLIKQPRGTSFECTTTIRGVKVKAIAWRDKTLVTLLSSFARNKS